MSKIEWIYFDKVDALMDDIPEDLWYNKHGQQFPDDDNTVDENVPSFPKLECLSVW